MSTPRVLTDGSLGLFLLAGGTSSSVSLESFTSDTKYIPCSVGSRSGYVKWGPCVPRMLNNSVYVGDKYFWQCHLEVSYNSPVDY